VRDLKKARSAHLVAPDRKLCPIAPARVRGVDEHDPIGVTRVPGVFGQAHLVARGLGREGRQRWLGVHGVLSHCSAGPRVTPRDRNS